MKLVSKVEATSRASFGGHGSSDQPSDLMLRFFLLEKTFPTTALMFCCEVQNAASFPPQCKSQVWWIAWIEHNCFLIAALRSLRTSNVDEDSTNTNQWNLWKTLLYTRIHSICSIQVWTFAPMSHGFLSGLVGVSTEKPSQWTMWLNV